MIRLLRSPFGKVGVVTSGIAALSLLLVPGLIHTLFSPGYFMPHVHCYLDNPRMVWLQGLSDFLIGASYMVISGSLAYLVIKERDNLPFQWMFLAFGLFIFSCGWTHLLEVWTLWHPFYWLSGGVKAITALVSIATAIGFVYLLPYVFRLIETAKISEQRRVDLVKAHADLQQAYKDLETFSYTLSHDIRGPLRAISSFSNLVLEDHRAALDGEGAEMMQKVVAASQRLNRLLDDVLALSRLSHGQIRTENLQPETTLETILHARPDLQTPRAEVQIQKPLLPVRGDAGSLSQCLENLLGNAAKFVRPGVTPRIRISSQAVGDRVRLWVEDNGIGVPAEVRQKIFEPFQRLHTQQEYEGTGIGLAIVRKAVQRMGGDAGVESGPEGSRFWLELPAATPTRP